MWNIKECLHTLNKISNEIKEIFPNNDTENANIVVSKHSQLLDKTIRVDMSVDYIAYDDDSNEICLILSDGNVNENESDYYILLLDKIDNGMLDEAIELYAKAYECSIIEAREFMYNLQNSDTGLGKQFVKAIKARHFDEIMNIVNSYQSDEAINIIKYLYNEKKI